MKSASISEIKNELVHLQQQDLIELCLKLARYKKENKELLSYLLFEVHNEQAYRNSVKKLIDEQFAEITQTNLYLVKKSLRKILRITNKHIKYSGNKETEAEVLLHFCYILKNSKIPFHTNKALTNLYNTQIKKISNTVSAMHEDLQYDFEKKLAEL